MQEKPQGSKSASKPKATKEQKKPVINFKKNKFARMMQDMDRHLDDDMPGEWEKNKKSKQVRSNKKQDRMMQKRTEK